VTLFCFFSLEADAHYTAQLYPVNTLKSFISILFKALPSLALEWFIFPQARRAL
jgi:hypothetical protein